MPYSSNKDLPENIQNTLPGDAQSIYRNAFNTNHDKTKDDGKAAAAGWQAVKDAGFKKQDDGNWKKFAKLYEWACEIFSVGKWNGDEYTKEDLQSLVANFNKLADKVKPPLKFGHRTGPGQPALGWVKSLELLGNKVVAKIAEVPEVVYNAITEGRYKRVSSEIYWNFQHSDGKVYDRVLKAVALLGADIPAVDDLADLTAYLDADDGSFDKLAQCDFEHGSEFKIKNAVKSKEVSKVSDQDAKKYQDKIDALEEEKKKLKKERDSANESLKSFQAKRVEKAREAGFEAIKEFCEDRVKKGKMPPAVRDKIVKAEKEFHFDSENDVISIPFDIFKEFAESVDTLVEFEDEKGVKNKKQTYDEPEVEVDRRAKEYVSKHDVDYSTAVKEVLNADSDLAEKYANYRA